MSKSSSTPRPLGEVETIDVAVPLRLVLQLERVPCLPQ